MNKIGFIGLGKMGIPMAQNLLKAGYSLSVYNRTLAKAEVLLTQGAQFEATPAALIHANEVVIVMVSDDDAINELFTGDQGLLTASTTAKIIINMSTVSPKISLEMAELLNKQGNIYLDAPVSGSLKQAIEGTLVIMVGGDENTFLKVKPIFDCLGKMALLVGNTGAGNSAKLAINALLSFHALGLAEAVVFARNQGIAVADLLALINNSALGNVFMGIKGEAIMQENFNPVFALKHISKDLQLAKNEGMDSPLTNTAWKSFTEAEAKFGEEDIIAILKSI